MCIKCEATQKAGEMANLALDMADALVDAYLLLKSLVASGAQLDEGQQFVYDKVSKFVRQGDTVDPFVSSPGPVVAVIVTSDSPDASDVAEQKKDNIKTKLH